jgi:hypothetical protein
MCAMNWCLRLPWPVLCHRINQDHAAGSCYWQKCWPLQTTNMHRKWDLGWDTITGSQILHFTAGDYGILELRKTCEPTVGFRKESSWGPSHTSGDSRLQWCCSGRLLLAVLLQFHHCSNAFKGEKLTKSLALKLLIEHTLQTASISSKIMICKSLWSPALHKNHDFRQKMQRQKSVLFHEHPSPAPEPCWRGKPLLDITVAKFHLQNLTLEHQRILSFHTLDHPLTCLHVTFPCCWSSLFKASVCKNTRG